MSLPATQQAEPSRPTVGLVLGAGGVRGCSHGGVIKVLSEAAIPIDVVVGASIGAMLGLALAAGITPYEIANNARETTSLDLLRFYAGRLHPTHSNPISRKIFEAGEGKNFEDLPRRFGVVATNIETGEPEIISSGPVLPAVQASIALPGVARAVNLNGRYYLDGGICDTIPVWAARSLGADRVIGVQLGSNFGTPLRLRGPLTQSLLRRLGRQTRPISGTLIDQIRFGCRQLSSFKPLERGEADVMIKPDFEGLNPNSMFGAAFSYWKGVEATLAALPEMQRLVMTPAAASTAILSRDPELRTDEVVRAGDLNTAAFQSLG